MIRTGSLSDTSTPQQLFPVFLQAVQGSILRSIVFGVKHALNNGAQTLSLARDDWDDPELPGRLVWVGELVTESGQVLAGFDRLADWTIAPQVLPELMAEVDRFHRMQSRLPSVPLKVSIPPGLPPLRTSPGRFLTALLAVLINAKEAMAGLPPAPLEIVAEAVGSHVEVRVLDRGAGLVEEIRPALFAPGTSSKPESHPGLGLAVARAVLRESGGDLVVEGREGGGCRAVLRLASW